MSDIVERLSVLPLFRGDKTKERLSVSKQPTQKMAVFWAVIRAIALMMEAARTSETLVNFYQTTRCYNPEGSHLHTHRRENLKS
jgi:hypothetical protein